MSLRHYSSCAKHGPRTHWFLNKRAMQTGETGDLRYPLCPKATDLRGGRGGDDHRSQAHPHGHRIALYRPSGSRLSKGGGGGGGAAYAFEM